MDIHRCRFVPYPPPAINALAFSHPSTASAAGEVPNSLRLAVGRANGDIEIWNPLDGVWFHESTLRGGKDRSIEGLVWSQDAPVTDTNGYDEESNTDSGSGPQRPLPSGKLRLFSIGYSSYVTEWDLATGRPLRHAGGNHDGIWSLAAQPRSFPSPHPSARTTGRRKELAQQQDLAIGCADGAVALLSTEDGDLRFKRMLAPPSAKKARVLSLAFRDRATLLAGCADGNIRVLDTQTGRLIRNMSLGAGPVGGPRSTLVWTVKTLPNGDVVSGDSTGQVCFWDGQTFTLLQRLKGHNADVLNLEVSADGQMVFSGGMDRRTALYKRTLAGTGSRQARWAKITHKRFHAHDVKAMAAFDSKSMSVVVSGGLDTCICIVPLREFGKEHYRMLTSLPQTPAVQSAPAQGLLLSWWGRELWLWRFTQPSAPNSSDGDAGSDSFMDGGRPPKLAARIALKGEENIASASLSTCGSVLAVSTAAETKLFRLGPPKAPSAKRLTIRKLEMPKTLSSSAARLVYFSPDTKWLCIVTPKNRVYLLRLTTEAKQAIGPRILPHAVQLSRLDRAQGITNGEVSHNALAAYERVINRAAFSADSRILVVSDLSGCLDSWVLEGYEDLTDEPPMPLRGAGKFSSPSSSRSSSPSSMSASSSVKSESDDDERHSRRRGEKSHTIFGQLWVRNPSSASLPRLSCAVAVLSFRPPRRSSSSSPQKGALGLHPTRHNAHPHSRDVPVEEDRLFAITARHQIFELEMLKGALSPWSRRNPSSCLPAEFRAWRDRAMGCFWDVSAQRERVWAYGSTWLCMFDLSRDFSVPPGPSDNLLEERPDARTKQDRKRKRAHGEVEELQAHTSGAGSKVHVSDLSLASDRKMRKFEGDEGDGDAQVITLGPCSPEELVTAGAAGVAERDLALSRRGVANGVAAADDGAGSARDDGKNTSVARGAAKWALAGSEADQARSGPSFWGTLRYRSILGIVPIGRTQTAEAHLTTGTRRDAPGGGGEHLELAVIERPLADLELPPRFYGDQDYHR